MKKNGFTLIEVVVVMGVLATLYSLSVPQLFRLRDRNTLQTTTSQLISVIREQQIQSMNAPQQYGMYFEQSQYVQFVGPSYNASDPTNIATPLTFPLEFTNIQLSGAQIVFATGSGEIQAYDENSSSFILEDSVSHDQRLIEFNSLGVPVIEY